MVRRRARGTPLSLVVNLDVPDSVILSRISDRWVHLPSGRVYNLSYNPPKVAGHDDETGEPLTKRPDDNPVRACQQHCVCLAVLTGLVAGNLRAPAGAVLRVHLAAARALQCTSGGHGGSGDSGDTGRDALGLDVGRDLAAARGHRPRTFHGGA